MANRVVFVTDSLFIFEEHERALAAAGLTVRRLDKLQATDKELIDGLRDAEGYILGGIERLTANVLEHAKSLKAIAFTGSGYKEFIPAYEEATRRGIAIAAATGGNAASVAEYTIALILNMLREIPDLMPPGEVKFRTTASADDTTIGILGLGSIGGRVAELCVSLGFKEVLAAPRISVRSQAIAGVQIVDKAELLRRSDVLSLHVSVGRGKGVLSAVDIDSLRPGTILINAAFPEAVDEQALVARIRRGELRAAFDAPMHVHFDDIPRGLLIQSNMQTAFNTRSANQRISDWTTRALISLLAGNDDPLLVNPEFKKYRPS